MAFGSYSDDIQKIKEKDNNKYITMTNLEDFNSFEGNGHGYTLKPIELKEKTTQEIIDVFGNFYYNRQHHIHQNYPGDNGFRIGNE